jgi:hypothetical protein
MPVLPKNDGSKFNVSIVHKFSANSSGGYPEIVTSIVIESIDSVLLGTKNSLLAAHRGKIIEIGKSAIFKIVKYEDLIFAIVGSERLPMFCYAKDVLKCISTGGSVNFHKIINKTVHTIQAGDHQGKIGLAVASSR